MRDTRCSNASFRSRRTNINAAFIGPTVWELEGPIPILKRSKTLIAKGFSCKAPSGGKFGSDQLDPERRADRKRGVIEVVARVVQWCARLVAISADPQVGTWALLQHEGKVLGSH